MLLRSPAFAAVVCAILLLPGIALACMWDYDTIQMERARFPSTLELITGKFLRHSPEFYRWRIENRSQRLQADPGNVSLLDDLAVAYDKTGQHDKAIETAQRTEALQPGRYETAANLGTFYFHSGKLEEGLPYIDRALHINQNAHFGREKYQKLLVEYVLERRKGGPLTLPLTQVLVSPQMATDSPSAYQVEVKSTFDRFLLARNNRSRPFEERSLEPDEAAAASKGILGMMKFGKHDSPVLLEALGTVLAPEHAEPAGDAKMLAARAYLKASYEVPEGPAREAYRGMAAHVLFMQASSPWDRTPVSLESVEADFQKELAEALAWYEDLRERELSWIRDGADPEAEFDKLYTAEPAVVDVGVKESPFRVILWVASVGGAVFVLVLAVGVVFLSRRAWGRRRPTPVS